MENTNEERLKHIEEKLDAVFVSTEKTRKYFLWTLVITAVTIILPVILLAFAIPFLFSTIDSISIME